MMFQTRGSGVASTNRGAESGHGLRMNQKSQVRPQNLQTIRVEGATNRSNYDIRTEAKDFEAIIGSLKDILNNSHNYSRL
jgi:hypothetical protein